MKIIIPNNYAFAEKCGVAAYTHALAVKLRESGYSVIEPKISNMSQIFSYIKRDTILHLQYPSLDSRFSLLPHVYSHISKNCIITFHETKTLTNIRRLCIPFFDPAACVVTNDYDFEHATTIFPRVNIVKIPLAPPFDSGEFKFSGKVGALKIVYFGLIRNDKGLDHVVEFSNLLAKLRPDVELHIVCGTPRSDQTNNFISFKNQLSSNTKIHVGTPSPELPNLLSQFDMAYLPFPNGADENRSSLLSLISLGVVPITYASERTPEKMRKLLLTCKSALEAVHLIPVSRELLRASIIDTLSLASNYSWDLVVRKHSEIYDDVIKR